MASFQSIKSKLIFSFELLASAFVGVAVTKVFYEVKGEEIFLTREHDHLEKTKSIINSHDNLKFDYDQRIVKNTTESSTNKGEINENEDVVDGGRHSRRHEQILKYGMPRSSTNIIRFKNHVLCFDQAKRIPLWVGHHLTRDKVTGDADRVNSYFKADPQVPPMFQSQNDDYWDSGWSRGHMTPAGDCRHDQQAMDDTFYLSNIVPQNYDNNSNFWYRMEVYCRSLTKRFSDVYVISGPLFLPHEEDGKHCVKYQVIGRSNVAVPTHLFKIILAEDSSKPTSLGAFVVPNSPIPEEHRLQDYQVSLETLETLSGIQFMTDLDRGKTVDICNFDGCKLLSKEIMEKIQFGRLLRNTSSIESLNELWDEMKRKGVEPDKQLTDIYEGKRIELSSQKISLNETNVEK